MKKTFIKAVLIVEGSDEEEVVKHLLRLHNIDGVDIRNMKGRDNLLSVTKSITDSKYRDVKRVGIIYDSEDQPEKSKNDLDEARQILLDADHPKQVSLLQLPAPDQAGSFEAVCLKAINADDGVLACARQYLKCLESVDHRLITQARKDKALLMAWYAASAGKNISRVGIDVSGEKHFDYTHAAFAPLVKFIQELVQS
jgi:hypothetical protein